MQNKKTRELENFQQAICSFNVAENANLQEQVWSCMPDGPSFSFLPFYTSLIGCYFVTLQAVNQLWLSVALGVSWIAFMLMMSLTVYRSDEAKVIYTRGSGS